MINLYKKSDFDFRFSEDRSGRDKYEQVILYFTSRKDEVRIALFTIKCAHEVFTQFVEFSEPRKLGPNPDVHPIYITGERVVRSVPISARAALDSVVLEYKTPVPPVDKNGLVSMFGPRPEFPEVFDPVWVERVYSHLLAYLDDLRSIPVPLEDCPEHIYTHKDGLYRLTSHAKALIWSRIG